MSRYAGIALCLLGLTLSGCFVQRFHNGSQHEPATQAGARHFNHYHHLGMGVWEANLPFDPQKRCKGSPWKTAEVRFNWLNTLIAGFGLPVYSNWTVRVTCAAEMPATETTSSTL